MGIAPDSTDPVLDRERLGRCGAGRTTDDSGATQTYGPDGCFRSRVNWGEKYAAAQAQASLEDRDPCNTKKFPDEEFWTYRVTNVTPLVVSYECTRNLRAQSRFVNSNVDLILFTVGGNDAGFSSIVQNCFIPATRNSAGCKTEVDAARVLLPQDSRAPAGRHRRHPRPWAA